MFSFLHLNIALVDSEWAVKGKTATDSPAEGERNSLDDSADITETAADEDETDDQVTNSATKNEDSIAQGTA